MTMPEISADEILSTYDRYVATRDRVDFAVGNGAPIRNPYDSIGADHREGPRGVDLDHRALAVFRRYGQIARRGAFVGAAPAKRGDNDEVGLQHFADRARLAVAQVTPLDSETA